MSLESKRLALLQDKNPKNSPPYPSLIEVSQIEEIFFDGTAEFELPSAKKCKNESTIEIIRITKVLTLFLFDRPAMQNYISRSIVQPLSRGSIQRHRPLLWTTKNKPLALEKVLLLHRHKGDSDMRVWVAIANKLAVNILIGTIFMDHYVRCTLFSLREIALRKSRSFYIFALGRKYK